MSGQHDGALLSKKAIGILCCIENEQNFGGYRVEQDGLYVVPLDADTSRTLTPEERAAAEAWHPSGQHDKPALPLPCTLGQLRAFVERAGLSGCIDEESVDAVVDEYALDSGGGGDAPKIDGGGAETAATEMLVRIKRSALIAKYEREWPSIEDDLRHSNENGLREAAKIQGEHGYWNEAAVVHWGCERGKLSVKQEPEAPKLDALTNWCLRQPS